MACVRTIGAVTTVTPYLSQHESCYCINESSGEQCSKQANTMGHFMDQYDSFLLPICGIHAYHNKTQKLFHCIGKLFEQPRLMYDLPMSGD